MYLHILTYAFSFAGIWIGSSITLGAVERLSRTLRISTFAISFLVLGFFTSVSEFSVGINSILINDPEIFVGNLIGASIVLFMLLIPILAIAGNSITITPEFRGFNLPASLVVIALPVILAMDGKIGQVDSIISLTLFAILVLAIQSKRGLLESLGTISAKSRSQVGSEILRICFGIATIFVASRFIVEQTMYFSNLLHVSPFFLSLLFIAIGTNIPELSIALQSIFMKNKQVAFGDYVGSASVNTFLIGLLTLTNAKPVVLTNSYSISLLFLVLGLVAFYWFAKTKNSISRLEGIVLLLLYILFVCTEILLHREALAF